MKKRYIQNATIIKTFVDDTPNEIRIPADAYKLCHTWPFYLPHPSCQSPLSYSVKTEIETWQKTLVENMRNSVTWLLWWSPCHYPLMYPKLSTTTWAATVVGLHLKLAIRLRTDNSDHHHPRPVFISRLNNKEDLPWEMKFLSNLVRNSR